MESKRMLVTMMIVMVMGNLLIQTEADKGSPAGICFIGCLRGCIKEKKIPEAYECPLICIVQCAAFPPSIPSPPSQMIATNEIDQSDNFCKLGCATQRCAPLSTLRNPNVNGVVGCLDSCSDNCSTKN